MVSLERVTRHNTSVRFQNFDFFINFYENYFLFNFFFLFVVVGDQNNFVLYKI